jgi:hypothetical protein
MHESLALIRKISQMIAKINKNQFFRYSTKIESKKSSLSGLEKKDLIQFIYQATS